MSRSARAAATSSRQPDWPRSTPHAKVWKAVIRLKGGTKIAWKSQTPYPSRERAVEAAEQSMAMFGAMKADLRPDAVQERANS